jgi:hypothetical protein
MAEYFQPLPELLVPSQTTRILLVNTLDPLQIKVYYKNPRNMNVVMEYRMEHGIKGISIPEYIRNSDTPIRIKPIHSLEVSNPLIMRLRHSNAPSTQIMIILNDQTDFSKIYSELNLNAMYGQLRQD